MLSLITENEKTILNAQKLRSVNLDFICNKQSIAFTVDLSLVHATLGPNLVILLEHQTPKDKI
jgi:hypothetical protein